MKKRDERSEEAIDSINGYLRERWMDSINGYLRERWMNKDEEGLKTYVRADAHVERARIKMRDKISRVEVQSADK